MHPMSETMSGRICPECSADAGLPPTLGERSAWYRCPECGDTWREAGRVLLERCSSWWKGRTR